MNPGKEEGGGARKKSKNRLVFFSRYLAANDAPTTIDTGSAVPQRANPTQTAYPHPRRRAQAQANLPPPCESSRYCFTSKLYCGSQSSVYCPFYLQSLPHCNILHVHCAIYAPHRPPPPVCRTPYNIGDGNIL